MANMTGKNGNVVRSRAEPENDTIAGLPDKDFRSSRQRGDDTLRRGHGRDRRSGNDGSVPPLHGVTSKTTRTDRYVGVAVRLRRKELGLTRTDLARAIGVTFQQVQKYENGTTRVLAGRLFAISQALEVPVNYFLQPVNGANTTTVESRTSELLRLPGASALLWHYSRVENPAHRRSVLELARSLAGQEESS